jgi:hypothetical protein
MKKIWIMCLVITVTSLIFAIASFAAEYKVYVKRIDQDLYQDQNSKAIIKTYICYEYVYGDEAILIWDGSNYFGCGKLIFIRNGTSCQVNGVYR